MNMINAVWDMRDCTATMETGANLRRITATRVAAGAILAGPVGALVGALAQKDQSKVYIALEVPGDSHLIEMDARDETAARNFVRRINAESHGVGA